LIQHGTSIHYDSLGRQDYVQSYIDGKKNGVWKIWYADGHLREIKTYSDGLLVGKYFLYSENPPHKLIEKKWYIKGELVKEKTYSKN
jgi:antitoxin component YwqK of YwqJK toxin-antitoxin module